MARGNIGLVAFLVAACLFSATVSGSNTFLTVVDDCIAKMNISRVLDAPDPLLQTIFTLYRQNGTYQTILLCIEEKIPALSNSNVDAEWFTGHMFDRKNAMSTKLELPVDKTLDCECVTKYRDVTSCLNITISILDHLKRQTASLSSNTEIRAKACAFLVSMNHDPLSCIQRRMQANNCSSKVQSVISEFTKLFTGGACSSSINTTPDPTPRVVTSKPGIDFGSSAIYRCGAVVYPGRALAMLFPPSEAVRYIIVNITKAAEVQKYSMEKFCGSSKHIQYANCLATSVRSPRNYADMLLKKFIDVEKVAETMDLFCKNKELIASQFSCTVSSMNNKECLGGLFDIIQYVERRIQPGTFGFRCSDIIKKIDCRVNEQLKVCNAQYATVMDTIYKGLLSPQCRTGGAILMINTSKVESMTSLLPCVTDYAMALGDRIGNYRSSNAISSLNLTNREEVENYQLDFIIKEMGFLCGETKRILDCAEETLQTSTKTLDEALKTIISISNLRKILIFGCRQVAGFKPHAKCITRSIVSRFSTGGDTCYKRAISEMSNNMSDLSKPDGFKHICSQMKPIGDCFKPSFVACSEDMADKFGTIMGAITESCNKPDYILNINEKQKGSHGTSVTVSLTTLLLTGLCVYIMQ